MRNDALYRGRRKFDLYVHNADRCRTIGKITAAMPGMDGDRIKYSPTSAKRAGEALKLAVISSERRSWCFVAICSTVTVYCSYSVFGNLYEIFKIARYAIRKIKERT